MVRSAMLAAVCAAAVLTPTVSTAQSNQQKPPKNECTELVAYVEARDDGSLDVTLEQARSFQDAETCRAVLAKLTANVQGGGAAEPSKSQAEAVVVEETIEGAIIEQQAPEAVVERNTVTAPTIMVEQPKSEVVVRQPRPEILVRQPAPVITIDIPQPEIIVRMPDPEVSVSQGEPQVQVEQPAEVVVGEAPQPRIEIGRAEQPLVRYESEDPQVRINRAEGEPNVRFEAAVTEETAGAPSVEITGSVDAADAPQETARAVVVSSLAGLEVVNAVGEKVGTVDRLLVSEQDARFYIVIAHGGFLGLGEAEALLPLDSASIAENRLVIRDLTDDQIRQLPGWDDDKSYREVSGDELAQISIAAR